MRRAALCLVLVVGCSDPAATTGDAAPSSSDDAAVTPLPDAPATCAALGPCDWLADYQHRIVSQLAGGSEIAAGTTLAHRASVAERNAARAFLLAEFTALGLTPVRHDYTSGSNTGANVIATLAGGSGPALLVGAHFDGVAAGPGAADNATGVAIVLAAARFLSTVENRQRPVIFALFDQEELGLVGSKAYVASLTSASTPLRGAHIFDMLAWDGDGDHAVELWSPSPALATLYQAHGPAAGTPIEPVTFASSDHQSFLDAGFVAVGIGEEFVSGDHTPHYHKATDTVANVSFAHLAVVTHLAFSVLEADVTAP